MCWHCCFVWATPHSPGRLGRRFYKEHALRARPGLLRPMHKRPGARRALRQEYRDAAAARPLLGGRNRRRGAFCGGGTMCSGVGCVCGGAAALSRQSGCGLPRLLFSRQGSDGWRAVGDGAAGQHAH